MNSMFLDQYFMFDCCKYMDISGLEVNVCSLSHCLKDCLKCTRLYLSEILGVHKAHFGVQS